MLRMFDLISSAAFDVWIEISRACRHELYIKITLESYIYIQNTIV